MANMDPLWAILYHPDKRFGKWDITEFFLTGEREIEAVMKSCTQLVTPLTRELALDFGCGVGRLTRALARYFRRCCGVDIAEGMIAKAKELNQSIPNCDFIVNTREDLKIFPDDCFDMIYSNIVLQHLPGWRSVQAYLAEFTRTLKRRGLLVFQLPSYIPLRQRLQPRRRLYGLFRGLGLPQEFLYCKLGLFPTRTIYVPEKEVTCFLQASGAEVLEVREDSNVGPLIESRTYYVTK